MTQASAKIEFTGQVDCLMVPLNDRQLLMPNVTVAEIISFSQLMTTNSSLDWMLGKIDWRGVSIPVVCYELLNGSAAPRPNPNARFAVINGVGENHDMPFYAMLVQGIPKLKKVTENEIQTVDSVMGIGQMDRMAVTVDGESAFIPDLDLVEMKLKSLS